MYFSDFSMKQKALWLAVWSAGWMVGYGVASLVLWLCGLDPHGWAEILVGVTVASVASHRLERVYDDRERRKRDDEFGKLFDDAGI